MIILDEQLLGRSIEMELQNGIEARSNLSQICALIVS